MHVTQEMIDWFEHRTALHIRLVREALEKIIEVHPEWLDELSKRGELHDQSKYGAVERIDYIWLTWFYRMKREGKPFQYPEGRKESVRAATGHHIKVNKHHVQAHENMKDMSDIDLAEMVADWSAMSVELKNPIRDWAEKFIPGKGFSDWQIHFICYLVSIFEPKQTRAARDCLQDSGENCPFASIGGLDNRKTPTAPDYIPEEEKEQYIKDYKQAAFEMYGPNWETCEFKWKLAGTIGGEDDDNI